MIEQLKEFQQMVHATARAKGFYKNPTNLATKIALAHSELSEALEVDRAPDFLPGGDGYVPNTDKQKFIAEELADCIIRILDMAAAHRLPVVEAMVEKAEKNKLQSMMHGGKLY